MPHVRNWTYFNDYCTEFLNVVVLWHCYCTFNVVCGFVLYVFVRFLIEAW